MLMIRKKIIGPEHWIVTCGFFFKNAWIDEVGRAMKK